MYNEAKRLTTTIKDIWNGKNRTAISGLSSDLEGRTHPCHGLHEPIAVAYAAAVARKTLGAVPERVCVGASGSMIKNVKSVIVPNTDNRKGLKAAAAAGIVAGRPEQKLEVIADVTPEETKAILAYLDQTEITVEHVDNGVTFDIIVTVWKGGTRPKCGSQSSTPTSSTWKRTAKCCWTCPFTATTRKT